MKPTSSFQLPIVFFFLLLAAFSSSLATARESPDAVRDTSGKILRTGTNYRIVPVHRGGGITLTTVGDDPCRFQVAQNLSGTGLPVTFWPVNLKKGVVRESTDLNVVFTTEPSCGRQPVWTVQKYDYSGEKYVTTGGTYGRPGSETEENWFKIERNDNGDGSYKFHYCPSVCPSCEDFPCQYVGVYWADGITKLGLTDGEPLSVRFEKALDY